MVMGMANLAMATGNIGRDGVGVNPLRGQNNVQGSCDMGSFPHELPGYRHVSDDDRARRRSRSCGARKIQRRAGSAHPEHVRRRDRRHLPGLFVQGEDIAQSDPNTKHVQAALAGDGARRRAGPVPQRDREVRPRVPAGHVVPREGRHLHQRRAADQPRASGDEAEDRQARVGGRLRDRRRPWATRCTTTPAARSWTRSPPSRRRSPASPSTMLDEVGSVQWPCNESAPRARRSCTSTASCAGTGRFVATPYVPTDGAQHAPVPADPDHRPDPEPVQRRRPDPSHGERRVAPEDVLEIHPHDAEERGINDGDKVTLASRVGETTLRASVADRMPAGWSTRRSTTRSPAPTW